MKHDKRYRCACALITFTVLNKDGNEICVTCGRMIIAALPVPGQQEAS